MEARFDGPAFDLQDIGDLFIRQALEIPQEDNCPMFRRERLQLCLNKGPALFLLQCPVRIVRRGLLHPILRLCHHQRLLLTSTTAEVVQAMIDRDAVEPGGESRCASKFVQGLEDLDEHVLSNVLSLTVMVEDPSDEGQYFALILLHQNGKRLPITAAATRHNLVIGIDLDGKGMHRRCRCAHRAPFNQYLATGPALAHDGAKIPSSTWKRGGKGAQNATTNATSSQHPAAGL